MQYEKNEVLLTTTPIRPSEHLRFSSVVPSTTAFLLTMLPQSASLNFFLPGSSVVNKGNSS